MRTRTRSARCLTGRDGPVSDVLYRGCTVPSRLPHIEAAVKYILKKMGMDVPDMEGEVCCMEPVGLRPMNLNAWKGSAAIIAGKAEGRRIISICDGCTISLDTASEHTGAEVTGFLELLHERIGDIRKEAVRKSGLRLAVFPGCHCEAVCERHGSSAVGMLSEIVSAVGATPLGTGENMCCGGGVSGVNDDLSKKIRDEAVSSFAGSGADAVVTSCPFCYVQFDTVARFRTYHIAEIVATAMGWDADVSQYHRA